MSNFGFSPGVSKILVNAVIDPVTMNPIVRGGSITVNPMGMPGKIIQFLVFKKYYSEDLIIQFLSSRNHGLNLAL